MVKEEDIIIVGDFKGIMIRQAKNANWNMIVDFCTIYKLVMGNKVLRLKDGYKYTREMKSRQEKSIIDLLLTNKVELHLVNDVREKRGQELGADHYLAEIRLKGRDGAEKGELEEIKREYQYIIEKHMEILEEQKAWKTSGGHLKIS